ncbi:MAG: hypothetical protein NC307_14135 [Roseburia sp.]|nr:hypothetical protein [Roseburia sp.]
MHTNETILTPLFRYLLWCIEKDGGIDFKQACAEIKTFYQVGEENKFPGVFEKKKMETGVF